MMKTFLLASVMTALIGSASQAAVVTTIGDGTAVTSPDRTAEFTGITGDLSTYTEDGLNVFVGGNHCCFSDVFYESGGNNSFVTIATSDGSDFTGLEFSFGTGFFDLSPQTLVWETLRNGIVTGSGLLTSLTPTFGVDASSLILGWSDILLMDTLRVAAAPTSSGFNSFGQFQAIALDNVEIDFDGTSPVPLPGALPLLLTGLGALAVAGSRRKKVSNRSK